MTFKNLWPLLILALVISSCGDLFYMDYPSRSQMKGPKANALDSLMFSKELIAKVDFSGEGISSFPLKHYLLFQVYNQNTLFLSNDYKEVSSLEIPVNIGSLNQFFEYEDGKLGFDYTERIGVDLNISSLYVLQNDGWKKSIDLDKGKRFNTSIKNAIVLDERTTVSENKYSYKTYVVDINTKETIQTLDGYLRSFAGYFFKMDNGVLTIFNSDNQLQEIFKRDITDFIAFNPRGSSHVYNAILKKNGNLLMLIRDENYDGVLLEFDGTCIKKLSIVPVGEFDSGRSFTNLIEDRFGNILIKADYSYYLLHKNGEWKRLVVDGLGGNDFSYGMQMTKSKNDEIVFINEGKIYILDTSK